MFHPTNRSSNRSDYKKRSFFSKGGHGESLCRVSDPPRINLSDLGIPQLPGPTASSSTTTAPVSTKPTTITTSNAPPPPLPVDAGKENIVVRPPSMYASSSKELGKHTTVGPPLIPKWVEHDRVVLRFYTYFKEAIVESANEAFRVRKCIFYYYVTDGTILITEPKEANSGIAQGTFLNRQVLNKPGTETPFQPQDLNIGSEVEIFKRVYKVVDLDGATRTYLEGKGFKVPEPLPYPEVPSLKPIINAKDKINVESFSKVNKPDTLKKFLEHDRKVLRFDAEWDEKGVDVRNNGKRYFTVHFYLADDTVEIREKHAANSGRENFPKLLARMKLPRANAKPGFVSADELIVGNYLNVFGRDLLLLSSDEFTQDYYKEHHNINQVAVDQSGEKPKAVVAEVPAYNGYGDDEDSLASMKSLVPKAAKKDLSKLDKLSNVVLRFEAKYEKPNADDKDRKFVFAFYLCDDSISIFSPAQRNSGVIAGKFLERGVYKNAIPEEGGEPRKFKESDFQIGKCVTLSFLPRSNATTKSFIIVDEDAFTKAYRRSSGALSPRSRFESTMETVGTAIEFGKNTAQAIELLGSTFDIDQLRYVSKHAFAAFLGQIGLSPDENMHAEDLDDIYRHFDSSNSGKIYYDEIFDKLALNFALRNPAEKYAPNPGFRILLAGINDSRANIRSIFRSLDVKNSGIISADDFLNVLKKFANGDGLSKDQLINLLSTFDPEKKGYFVYNEFCDSLFEYKHRPKQTIAADFVTLDLYVTQMKNRQAVSKEVRDIINVSKEFVSEYLGKESHVRKTFLKFDIYKDGTVNKNEFFTALDILCPEMKPKNKQILIDHFFKKGEIIRANFNNFASAVYALGKEEVEKKSK